MNSALNNEGVYVLELTSPKNVLSKIFINHSLNVLDAINNDFKLGTALINRCDYSPTSVLKICYSNDSSIINSYINEYSEIYGNTNIYTEYTKNLGTDFKVKKCIEESIECNKTRCYNCCRIGHHAKDCEVETVHLLTELPEKTIMFCFSCRTVGHTSLYCKSPILFPRIDGSTFCSKYCIRCKSTNHTIESCGFTGYQIFSNCTFQRPYCLLCNRFGHIQEYCYQNPNNLMLQHQNKIKSSTKIKKN
jgi:hypothetical protein